MTTSSAPAIPFRIRKLLRATPGLTTTLNAARALVHFGPWRHAARALIRWRRPPLHDDATRAAGSLSLNAAELARTLRGDGMVRAGRLPPDVVRRVRAITDGLPPGEYGDFHEQPDIRALVLGADVLNVVRGYLGAEPELLECNLVVGHAEDPARTPIHVQRHFHFDFAGWESLNLFVYLTDVEADSGAHQVVIGTHRVRKVRDAVRPWVPDDEINARYPGRVRTIAGPAGTMFFETTEAFHRRLIFKGRRVMLNVLYASHRSWSSEGRLTPKYSDYARTQLQAILLAGAIMGVGACGSSAAPQVAPTAQTREALTALREATRPFQDVAAAIRAGYAAEVAACIVHEHHGAMGYHHLNRSYIERDISVERPQFLLYERLPGGEYRLNAAEFFIPYRLWPRDSTPPVFLGQSMKREDTFEYWYLHVWAWRENPEGMFADFHPAVQCPEAARKVYRPNPPPAETVLP